MLKELTDNSIQWLQQNGIYLTKEQNRTTLTENWLASLFSRQNAGTEGTSYCKIF